MKETVVAFMDEHKLIRKGATVLVGVSGGPDSLALLHMLNQLKETYQLRLIAVTIDHCLREDSRDDSLYVERISEQWGIEAVHITVDTPLYKRKHHVSTQVAARKLRYEAFEKEMLKHNSPLLALAHHGDDQVETILMQITRSADPSAILGIPIRRSLANGEMIRPFLALNKDEILAYCKQHGLIPRIDSSNEETDYTRNLFRKEMIPLLKERNEQIHRTMQKLSESLTSDEIYMRSEAKRMLENIAQFNKFDRTVTFLTNRFTSYPFPLQRRAFHLILNYLYVTLPNNLSHSHEGSFFALLRGRDGTISIDFPDGLKLRKSYDEITFYFASEQEQTTIEEIVLPVPGELNLPNGAKLTAEYIEGYVTTDRYTYICKDSEVNQPIIVRSLQSGDRMEIQGLQGTKKLQRILIDEKIPSDKRTSYPVITDALGKIIWLAPLRKGKETSEVDEKRICLRYHQPKTT